MSLCLSVCLSVYHLVMQDRVYTDKICGVMQPISYMREDIQIYTECVY